jgi:uncharacterized protein (TIGR03437 family)
MQYRVVNRCRTYIQQLPNITPIISNLSIYSSISGMYTIVYINGDNFSLSGPIGYSTVVFGNYIIPVTFLSPQNIAFVVPSVLGAGTYPVLVVNNNYPISLYSNSVNYPLL